MKVLFCVLALAVALCGANRAKRFAGLNVAGIGGSAGCVVTGNKLYANGFYLRELTEEEETELLEYEEEAKKYKEQLKAVAQQKLDANSQSPNVQVVRDSSKITVPKAPKKPSFCSTADTTQYYFDGCMVQNNKVYVGREYARDLSADEIAQLKVFDAKMSVYQKYVSQTVNERVNKLFGGKDIWSILLRGQAGTAPEAPTTPAVSEVDRQPPPPVPDTPSFCTAIY